jgi:hypothetical protein
MTDIKITYTMTNIFGVLEERSFRTYVSEKNFAKTVDQMVKSGASFKITNAYTGEVLASN